MWGEGYLEGGVQLVSCLTQQRWEVQRRAVTLAPLVHQCPQQCGVQQVEDAGEALQPASG